jgi:hypothetical protein
MIVDFHSHFYPREYLDRLAQRSDIPKVVRDDLGDHFVLLTVQIFARCAKFGAQKSTENTETMVCQKPFASLLPLFPPVQKVFGCGKRPRWDIC